MSVFNHYSFVVLALVLVSIAAAATWRVKRRWLRATIPGVIAVGMAIAFFALRTGGGNVHRVSDLDGALASGKPRKTGVDYLASRLMHVQVLEVARCLEEGILREKRDAEVGAIFGIGFAPSSGGPLAWMDRRGIAEVVATLESFAAEDPVHGARWSPPRLLEQMEKSGLVSRVVPADKLLDEALAVAAQIASYSLPVVMKVKEAVNRAYESSLAEGLLFERREFHATFALDDQKEGMRAFVEKRKPSFKHR